MGCFDSVFIKCPKCGYNIEFQSKAGRCDMYRFNESKVPIVLADDIDGEVMECPTCHTRVMAKQIVPVKTVAMHGVVYSDHGDSDGYDDVEDY